MTATTTTAEKATIRRDRWIWVIASGIALLVIGLTGASVATLLEFTSLLVFGPLLLASSLIQILATFFAENGKVALLHFVAAALEAAFAFFLMSNPAPLGLFALVGTFLVAIGLLRLARLLATRPNGRPWIVMTGTIALIVGASIWMGWPSAALWVVGLFIAVDLFCHGIAWTAMGLADRPHVLGSMDSPTGAGHVGVPSAETRAAAAGGA